MSKNYIIEVGVDSNARSLSRGTRYLPADIVDKDTGALSTYAQLKMGDTIEIWIFDISSLTTIADNTLEPQSLRLLFEPARATDPTETPFNDTPRVRFGAPVHEQMSTVFGKKLFMIPCLFQSGPMVTIDNTGFFVATYTLSAKFGNGPVETYVHDPEWIISPGF